MQVLSPAQYVRSRTREAIALSHEIQESKGSLGYLTIKNAISFTTKKGVTYEFTSRTERDAAILRMFW